MKTNGVSSIPKFRLLFFLGHPILHSRMVCFKIYGQSNDKVYTTLFRVFNKSDIPTCEQKKSAKFLLEELSFHKFFCSMCISFDVIVLFPVKKYFNNSDFCVWFLQIPIAFRNVILANTYMYLCSIHWSICTLKCIERQSCFSVFQVLVTSQTNDTEHFIFQQVL